MTGTPVSGATSRPVARSVLNVLAALSFGLMCAIVLGELMSWAYFRTLGGDLGRPTLQGRIGRYDSQLGYRLLPNAEARLFSLEFDTIIRINGQGLRQARGVPYQRMPGTARILLVGDSFTFGHGVNDGERFSERLASQFNDLEIVNMGVAGTGTDQQFLLYEEEGVKYSPDLVILGYMVENIRRNGSNWRLVPGAKMEPKPRFVIRDGQLTLTNVPVPTEAVAADPERLALEELRSTGLPIPFKHFLQMHSYLYKFVRLRLADRLKQMLRSHPNPYPEYDVGRPEWQVTTELFRRFAREARNHGGAFLLVIIPSPEYIFMPWLDGRPYRMLEQFCREEHLDCLDLRPGILGTSATPGARLYYPLDGHWTPEGHAVAGRLIGDYLSTHFADIVLTQATGSNP